MFERYTEKARRVVFFARYEASEFGSPSIETEHVLLGLLREDKALFRRFLQLDAFTDTVRKQIENRATLREKISTSVDLPLSNESKRVLAYAAEEAQRLGHNQIGTEHLLLGLLREEGSFAAEILNEGGVRISSAREELARSGCPSLAASPPRPFKPPSVTIQSTPTGADIEIEGVFLGHTPAELPLDAGHWLVRISKNGYKPWERMLKVLRGGHQTISAELERAS